MENNKYSFAWKFIIPHVLIVAFFLMIFVLIMNTFGKTTLLDYFSGIGNIASIYGILLTLWQLNKVKEVAQAARDAAMSKAEEIESITTYSSLQREKEMCNSIVSYIKGKQFEAAAIKLDNIREHLIEIKTKLIHSEDDKKNINNIIIDIGNDSVNLRRSWMNSSELDTIKVIEHVNSLSIILAELSSKYKSYNYDR